MLHALSTCEAPGEMMRKPFQHSQPTHEFSSGSAVAGLPPRFTNHVWADRQKTFGNQAVLRMLNKSTGAGLPLQRKCGCGGAASACTSCRDSPPMEFVAQPNRTHEIGPEEAETERYSDQGVLLTLQGSGTCNNGGAESGCDIEIGAYKIYANRNTCCTKTCSLKHEQTHVTDMTNWGCCKAASVAYNAKGADKGKVVDKYNDWLRRATVLTECHAYTNGVKCANQLSQEKDCAGAGKDTDCCKDIAQYISVYGAKAKTNCDAAPKDPPPCPAF